MTTLYGIKLTDTLVGKKRFASNDGVIFRSRKRKKRYNKFIKSIPTFARFT